MGIGEKMKGLAVGVQDGVKSSTLSLTHFALRLVSGFFMGLTVGLIGQELSGYGSLALVFVSLVVLALFVRLSKSWSLMQILIFDLICVLVAQLLRMYILLAP